jgi:hypothetical protein
MFLTMAMVIGMMPTYVALADEYVCEVNGVPKTSFPSSFSTNNMTVKLLQDVSTTMRKANTVFTKNVTIDLNGYDLTVTNVGEDYPAIYICRAGSNFTITGPGSIIAPDASAVVGMTQSNSTVTIGQDVKLIGDTGILLSDGAKSATVNFDGEIDADTYGVYVNGQLTDESAAPTMNIGGTIESDAYGIYGAGCAVWNVSGDITAGTTGIEIRAGELNVKDGASIESTATTFSAAPNGNGTSVMGAGIAVSQHTTKKPIAVNIEGGTITGPVALYQSDVQGNGAEATSQISMDVSGGTFDGTLNDNAVDVADVENFISGGSFNEDIPEGYLAEGCATTEDGGTYEIVAQYTAKIGDVLYPTLADAVAAAENGQTIKMINDEYLESTVEITAGKTIILDLNGKEITVSSTNTGANNQRSLYAIDNYGNLTIKDTSTSGNGKIVARGIENLENGVLTMDSGTIESCDRNGGAAIWNEATLEMNGGTLLATYAGAAVGSSGPGCLNNSGTATINHGTFTSQSTRCYAINSSGDITINDATVSGVHGGLAINGGTAVINDGTYESQNYYGLYVSNDGTGTDPETAQVTVNGGEFTGNTKSVLIGSDVNNPVNSTIEINDGTFNQPITVQSGIEEAGIEVKGGSFATQVPEEYCAEGYTPVTEPDANGMYTVDTAVATIGTDRYDTLADAVAAADSGATITLVNNVELDAAQTISKEVTLDLNGHTISGNNISRVIDITPTGDLTIEDSDGDGKITIPQTNISTRSETIGNHGSLTINGGTIENKDAWAGGGSYAIRSENKLNNATTPGDEVTINGGNIICPNGYGFAMFQGDSFTMTNGNIESAYGVANNGNAGETTTMNISGGTITATDAESAAIYHPGNGTLNITGGTLTGATGVEIRAGELNMTGGTIIGTGEGLSSDPNGNGSTTVGAGIAVVQHNTRLPIDVNISGGTIQAAVALYEKNVQNNPAEDIAKISFDVSGGTFTSTDTETGAAIATQDMDGFVRGGTFNTPVDEEDCAQGFVPEDNGDGTYGVTPDEGLVVVDPYKGNKEEKDWTYPTESGKIFAGWYTDETCTTPYTGTTGAAYPKFVDEKTLKAKTQIKKGAHDSLRFISTVDKTDYKELGFLVQNKDKVVQRKVPTLYNSIVTNGSVRYANYYSPDAIAMVIYNLNNLPNVGEENDDFEIVVTPYWITADGTFVRGIGTAKITRAKIDAVK